MMIFTKWHPANWTWKGVLIVLVALLLLAGIPQIGIAVLNYQADECSVPSGEGYQVLRGSACEQYFPELSNR